MRRLTRAPIPPSLLVAGARELQAAQEHFEGTGAEDGFTYKAYGASEVKVALTAMTGGKCAYCEADYDATQPNDVEHFRPKGAIDTNAGRIKPGYWWLAAAWDNLLPSCIRCNRKENQLLYDGTALSSGKANLFPLVDETKRASAIGDELHEDPLLIDPCREDPAIHLQFVDDMGRSIAIPRDPDPTSISARKARTSIDIYGLNREGVVRDRSRYLRSAKLSLARLTTLARRLDRLPANAIEDRTEVANLIEQELDHLGGLTCGEDRYTGMLQALINPQLMALNLAA